MWDKKKVMHSNKTGMLLIVALSTTALLTMQQVSARKV